MNPLVSENLKPFLTGKKILLGISGSIAAFKACNIVRFLKDCGSEIRVIFTESAHQFVTPLTLETLSGQPVEENLWKNAHGTHHIDMARWADLVLIAPASANTIAKLAHGLASDLLSTELLAFKGPVLIAPAMNPAMYSHPAVQKNLSLLQEHGYKILGPANGQTACGEEGLGRMLEPEAIVEEVALTFSAKPNGKKILLTLGPTQSAIDPVRYLTNRSSGLMGASLCWAALQSGFEVHAVCGPCEAPLPTPSDRFHAYPVVTASQMANQVFKLWKNFDFFIGTAAVLDWDIKSTSHQKLKKQKGNPHLELTQNTDILAHVSKLKKPRQFVLGFAAETQNVLENGLKKLKNKKLDAIFINNVSQNHFGSPNNAGFWVARRGEIVKELTQTSKAKLARTLINLILDEINHRPTQAGSVTKPLYHSMVSQ